MLNKSLAPNAIGAVSLRCRGSRRESAVAQLSTLVRIARFHFIVVLVASFALDSGAAESVIKIRLEMWERCLCGGPDHSRTYDHLKGERAKRMSFGTDVAVTGDDSKLAPLTFLRHHLGDSKPKDRADFYWKGIVYRQAADGQSYSLHFRGALRKLKMSEMKDGDLIVYYKESY